MMGTVSPSRRAKAFAQALDERESEGTAADRSGGAASGTPAGAAEKTGAGLAGGPSGGRTALLSMADRLGALPKPSMDPDVKAAQRAQLLAAVENAFAGSGEGASVPGPRSARTGRRGTHRASLPGR